LVGLLAQGLGLFLRGAELYFAGDLGFPSDEVRIDYVLDRGDKRRSEYRV
jgi:hypothetical protein